MYIVQAYTPSYQGSTLFRTEKLACCNIYNNVFLYRIYEYSTSIYVYSISLCIYTIDPVDF